MQKKILQSFLLFIFIFSQLSSKEGYIEWKSIKEANGYQIEIRDKTNKIVVRETVKTNRYPVKTPMGNYQFRISPLNVFEKPTVWSYWNPLKVIVSRTPEIQEKVFYLSEEDLGKPILLKGKNFLEAMDVKLYKSGKEINIIKKEFIDNTQFRIRIDPNQAETGRYDLYLENPNDKKSVKKNYLVIGDSLNPIKIARLKKEEEDRKAKEEAERLARLKKEEEDRKAKAEAERLARLKKEEEDRKAKEEAERLARLKKEEEDRKAKEEAERLARLKKEEEDRKAKEEAERLARLKKEEADRKAKEEAERLARLKKEEEDRKAKEEAERLARLKKEEEDRKAKAEAERLARLKKEEEDRKAKEEAERLARLKKEEEDKKAKEEAERLARLKKEEEDRKAKEEAERLARLKKEQEKQKAKEVISSKELYGLSMNDLDAQIQLMKRNCGITELPEVLVDECFKGHITVNLRDKQREDLYNYIRLQSENYSARLSAYQYFRHFCQPHFKAVVERLEARLKQGGMDTDEKMEISKVLQRYKSCT